MKKLILSLLLVASFLIAGFEKAGAVNTVVSITSLGVTGGPTNGLAVNPLNTAQNGIAIGGFTLSGSATGTTTRTVSVINFVTAFSTPQFNNYYFATVSLYSSTSSTFMGLGAPQTGVTPLATYTMGGNYNNIAFTGLNISVSGGTTLYYFMVVNYTGVAANSTFELDYTSSTISGLGGTPAANGTNTGFNYTVNTIPVSAVAASLTTTAGSNGLSTPAAITTTGNYTVYGMSLTPSASGTAKVLTGLTFTTSGAPAQTNNYFYGTAYLYASTSNVFNGTAVQISTVTTGATNTLAFGSFTTPQTVTAGTTKYYYVVIVYTSIVPATATQTITYTSATSTATITAGASVAGPTYTYNYSATPYVLTLNSLTTTQGTNGLVASPVPYGSTNYSVYGFSLIGTGNTAGTSSMSSITFNQTGTTTDPNTSYYTTAYLYSSPTSTFAIGTATQLASTLATSSANSITFTPGTAITATNSTNANYFVVFSDTKGDNNPLTYKLTYASSTVSSGTAVTSGASLSGPAYTFAAQPKTTVTFNGIGASGGAPTSGLTADPISTFRTGMALYGFTLAGSGSGANQTVTTLTFTRGDFDIENNNDFFPTLTLYSSTNPTFPGVGGAGVSVALGSVNLGANQNNFAITPTTPLTVTSSTTPVYYFLVADYTTLGNYSGYTYEIDEAGVTTGSGATATITNPYGWDYTFTPPTITTTDVVAGLSPAPPATIYQGQSGLAVAGIGLSVSMGSTPLTALVFASSQNKATEALYFNATPQLYVSTSPVFSLSTGTIATLVTTATPTIATGGNITFAITGQSITTTTLYYYMVLNYSVTGGATPKIFQFAPTNYTATANGGGQNTGYGGTPNSYTCAPPVYVYAASTNGFPPSTLANSQTDIPIIGFAIATSSSNTFSTFNFTTTESAGNVGTYFYNVRLYSSTTNDFTTAAQVTDPGLTISALTGANFSISGLTQTISNSTVYYFVVVDYTAPNPGPVNFTPTLASVVSSSPTVTTYSTAANGLPITGTAYTLKTILSYTYYWWGTGATGDWRDPANWTTSTSLSGANAGAYPGVFATDNAIVSYDYWSSFSNTQSATIGAYNIKMANLTVTASPPANFNARSTFNITVNSADSLSVASLTIGNAAATKLSALNILGTTSGGVISSLNVAGVSNLYNNATLTASTNGIINFPSTSSFNFVGNATYAGTLSVAGGLVNTNGCNFSFSPGTTSLAGLITVSSGKLSVNGGVLNMNGILPELQSTGGISNYNSTTINVTGSAVTGYVLGLAVSGGTMNVNGTSTKPSVVNLGTAANNGVNSEVYTSGGNFNLGAYSTLNILTVNSPTTNYNFYNGGGVVTCASTSFINPTSTTAWLFNSSASNYFTLLSDANGSATIGPLGVGAKMTGQYNVQRYISTASRNYRLLASPVNVTNYLPGNAGTPNLVNVYALSQTATVPTSPVVTYPGAWVGGPAGTGAGFTAATGGPCLYLYQESIVPSLTYYNSTYYSGKNIAVTGLSNPYLSTQSSAVALGGTGATASDNGTGNILVPPGNGYLLYYVHDNTSTSAGTALNATATTGVGYINQGTIPLVVWGAAGSTTSALTNNGVSQATNPHAFAGLTMVGNPYPSSIDLQKVYSDNTGSVFTNGTNESFSELNPINEQFATYGFNGTTVTTSGSDATRYVASGQGFYITVTNPGQTLTFYEDQKTTLPPTAVVESIPVTNPTVDNVATGNLKTTDALVRSANLTTTADLAANSISTVVDTAIFNAKKSIASKALKDTIKFGKTTVPVTVVAAVPAAINTSPLRSAGTTPAATIAGLHLKLVQDTINYDEAGVYFNKGWVDKFSSNDAMDQDGVGGKVWLSSYTTDKVRTSINGLGDYTAGKRIPLFVKFSAAGLYKLQMSDIANFNTRQYSVFLLDNMLKDSLDLTLYKSYNFNYTTGTANDSTRFVLAIEHKPIPHYALLAFAGEKVTPGVKLNWKTLNEGNITTFVLEKLSANNTYAFLDSLQSDSAGQYSYVDQHPTLGNNTYRLQQTDGLGNITYSAPVTIGYNSTNPNGGLTLYPNPAKSTMTVTLATTSNAVTVATADVYNSLGKLVTHKVVNSNSFVHDVSGYDLGIYIIELKNSNGVLVGKSKFVKVN